MSTDQPIKANEMDARHRIEQEAAQWHALQQSGASNRTLDQEFDQWLSLSAVHREAYLEVELTADALAEMAHHPEAEQVRESLIGSTTSIADSETGDRSGWAERLANWMLPRPIMIASTAVLALAVSTVLFWNPNDPISPSHSGLTQQVYQAEPGQLFTTRLADGSNLILGPMSRARVRFDEDQRLVELVEGEAFFDVAKDTDRPFYVSAGKVSVKVVGTQFDVRRLQRTTSVGVIEGVVQVFPKSLQELHELPVEQATMLVAGQQLKSDLTGVFHMDTVATLDEMASWREGRLVYRDALLIDILADANRYGLTPQIRLDSPVLGDERVTLSLHQAQVADLPDMLAELLPIRVQRTTREILLQSSQ